MCRMAVQNQLKHHTRRLILVASAFPEIDLELSQAVADFWSQGGGSAQADGSPWPPHQWIVANAWDLFRADQRDRYGRPPLASFVDSLPQHALLLIVSGWPCTDLAQLATWEGWAGLQGMRWCLFFTLPMAKTQAEERRPDLFVHQVGENVATMRQAHRDAVMECLGNVPGCLMVIDSREWTECPHTRNWFATFRAPQCAEDVMLFPKRPSPWESGWAFSLHGRVPT